MADKFKMAAKTLYFVLDVQSKSVFFLNFKTLNCCYDKLSKEKTFCDILEITTKIQNGRQIQHGC